MNSIQNLNFQLGLLHLAHLLVNVDGIVDEQERKAIRAIKDEEHIPEPVFQNFEKAVASKSEREIYQRGLDMLGRCDDDEKLSAFIHLYRLSEADQKIDVKEVRLLLYSMKASNIAFEDVELGARMFKAQSVR